MRFKYYLRGLGLGILTTTIIFMVSIRIHGGIMTDDRAIERAKDLGMIVPEETSTELETEKIQEEPENDLITELSEQETNAEANLSTIEQQNADESVNEVVVVTIAEDDVCRTAGEKLLAAGLIDDVEVFRDYMSEVDYAGLIRGGTYEIPMDADMELVAKIITGQNE